MTQTPYDDGDEGVEDVSRLITTRFPHLSEPEHEDALCDLVEDLLNFIKQAARIAASDARSDERYVQELAREQSQ